MVNSHNLKLNHIELEQPDRLLIPVRSALSEKLFSLQSDYFSCVSLASLLPIKTSHAYRWRHPVDCGSVSQGSINYSTVGVYVHSLQCMCVYQCVCVCLC